MNRMQYLTRVLRQTILLALLLFVMMPISVSAQGKVGNSDGNPSSVFIDEEGEFDQGSKGFESTKHKAINYSAIVRKKVHPERKSVQSEPSITTEVFNILERRYEEALAASKVIAYKNMDDFSESTSKIVSSLLSDLARQSHNASTSVVDDIQSAMNGSESSSALQAIGQPQQGDYVQLYKNMSVQVTGHRQKEQSRVKSMMEQGFSCSAQKQKTAIVREETLF